MDGSTIAATKNRFKKYLNRLPIGENPTRWTKIKEYVRIINTASKECILDGWKRTLLTDESGVEDQIINEDVEEEMLLQEGLETLYLEDQNGEDVRDDDGDNADEVELVPVSLSENGKKKERQSQITDYFRTSK